VVPAPTDLRLGNDAIDLQAAILYADMAGSTALVDGHSAEFAAEVYKSFLTCAARTIKGEGGVITAYDGDRIMAVYLGDTKETSAVKTALKINYAVKNIVQPALAAEYPGKQYTAGHSVGIDTSRVKVARIGVRNDNDLVWVGRAANYAAKLSDLRTDGHTSWITGAVYNALRDEGKFGGNPRRNMWEERTWTPMNNMQIYRSNWWWGV
jgi:class 3 adenylate cyclase